MKFYVTPEDDQTWFPAADGLYYPGDDAAHVGMSFQLGVLNRSNGRTVAQLLHEGAEAEWIDTEVRLRLAQRMLTSVGMPEAMAAAISSTACRYYTDGKNASLQLLLDEIDAHIVEKIGAP